MCGKPSSTIHQPNRVTTVLNRCGRVKSATKRLFVVKPLCLYSTGDVGPPDPCRLGKFPVPTGGFGSKREWSLRPRRECDALVPTPRPNTFHPIRSSPMCMSSHLCILTCFSVNRVSTISVSTSMIPKDSRVSRQEWLLQKNGSTLIRYPSSRTSEDQLTERPDRMILTLGSGL